MTLKNIQHKSAYQKLADALNKITQKYDSAHTEIEATESDDVYSVYYIQNQQRKADQYAHSNSLETQRRQTLINAAITEETRIADEQALITLLTTQKEKLEEYYQAEKEANKLRKEQQLAMEIELSRKEIEQMRLWLKNYYIMLDKLNEEINRLKEQIIQLIAHITQLDRDIIKIRLKLSSVLHKIFNNLFQSNQTWEIPLPSGRKTRINEKDLSQEKLSQFAEAICTGKIASVEIFEALKALLTDMMRDDLIQHEHLPPYHKIGTYSPLDTELEIHATHMASNIFKQGEIQSSITELLEQEKEKECLIAEKNALEQLRATKTKILQQQNISPALAEDDTSKIKEMLLRRHQENQAFKASIGKKADTQPSSIKKT